MYPSVPLEFIIKTSLGLSQAQTQVAGGAELRTWWDLCQFDSVWQLDWTKLHDRYKATGEYACVVEPEAIWFDGDERDLREPLERWQRLKPASA